MNLRHLDLLEISYLFAEFKKLLDQKASQAKYQKVLEKQIEKRLQTFLTSPQTVFKQFSLISWDLIKAMDTAFMPDISPEDQFKSFREQNVFVLSLLKLVNSSVFQAGKPKDKPKITSPKHAVTYLGSSAMKMVIPYFLLRKQALEENVTLRRTTLRLWKETLGTAIYTCELAELRGHSQYSEAFSTSIMIGLCKFIIGKAYLDIFETVRTAYLEKARKEFNVELLDGIKASKLSHTAMCVFIEQHWLNFTISIAEKAEFKFLPLHENLVAIKNIEQSPDAFIETYQIGYYYNLISNLRKNSYLSDEDTEKAWQTANIDMDEIQQLKSLRMTLRRLFNKEKHNVKIADMIQAEKKKDDARKRGQTPQFRVKYKDQ